VKIDPKIQKKFQRENLTFPPDFVSVAPENEEELAIVINTEHEQVNAENCQSSDLLSSKNAEYAYKSIVNQFSDEQFSQNNVDDVQFGELGIGHDRQLLHEFESLRNLHHSSENQD
jgi:hypothetical protein